MNYELLFLQSLALTILIETIVIIAYFRFILKEKEIGISRLLWTGFIASFATLPYLWFILPQLVEQRLWYIVIGESFAVVMETFIIAAILRTGFIKSFLCSLSCNMISFCTGLLISWP